MIRSVGETDGRREAFLILSPDDLARMESGLSITVDLDLMIDGIDLNLVIGGTTSEAEFERLTLETRQHAISCGAVISGIA